MLVKFVKICFVSNPGVYITREDDYETGKNELA